MTLTKPCVPSLRKRLNGPSEISSSWKGDFSIDLVVASPWHFVEMEYIAPELVVTWITPVSSLDAAACVLAKGPSLYSPKHRVSRSDR